jgi:exopolysaccharide production protein ExoZ
MRRDTTQIESVQILRAVAAMAVLIYHTHYVIGIVLGVESYPALAFGAAGVDLFFVISGFVMVYVSEPLFGKPGATLKFWTRRVIRIVPLYWTMTTLLLIYLTARYGGVDYVGKTWQGVVASYLFLPYPEAGDTTPLYAVGWTLNFEMFFYLVVGLAARLPRRACVMTVSIGLTLFWAFGKNLPLPLTVLQWSNPMLLEFVFGMLIALAYREGVPIPLWLCRLLVLAGCVAFALSCTFAAEPRTLYWGVPASMVVTGCVFAGNPKSSALWRAGVFLGDCSYSLYLVHPIALSFPRQLGIDFAKAQPFAYSLLIIAVATGVGIAVHLLYERPATIAIKRGLWGRPLPASAAG